jgi:hypothetical protein
MQGEVAGVARRWRDGEEDPGINEMTDITAEPLISSISVVDLFGLYTYSLPPSGTLSNAAILYGDNGVGKSTILRLAFHLLSFSGNRGHRSALWAVHFKRLEVKLSSGVVLLAERPEEGESAPLNLSVVDGDQVLAQWIYIPKSSRKVEDATSPGKWDRVLFADGTEGLIMRPTSPLIKQPKASATVPFGETAYLAALQRHAPAVFLLNAERRLDSDSIADPDDEIELRRVMHYEEPKRLIEVVRRSREIALSQALRAASTWIQKKAVLGANQGSMNVHGVYANILSHIVGPGKSKSGIAQPDDTNKLIERLENIAVRSSDFARYELTAPIAIDKFVEALQGKPNAKKSLAASLIRPYLESLEGRLNALQPVYQLVDEFVSTINAFLQDKILTFGLSQGFEITSRRIVRLAPSQLSSGEQQLLLLFCYVLKARDQPSIFMIDEPEISLNIKWQRRLIQSLLDITVGTRIQFLFASHSMELLSQHRERVIPLKNTR